MRKFGVVIVVSALLCVSLSAQNNRSAVSLTGIDAASCTVPDPCRTFDVAISKAPECKRQQPRPTPMATTR
jgi:hypothetical protein